MGTLDDPIEFKGLVHLLEHLLFVRSLNYPETRKMETFIRKTKSKSNATTGDFVTTFYFELSPEHADEFTNLLLDAIKNPVFETEDIKNELDVINSEIDAKLMDDKDSEMFEFLKRIGNKYSRLFNDGLVKTDINSLDLEKLRNDLFEVHKKYYVPNNMQLVVITDLNTVDVIKKIEQEFVKLEDKPFVREYFNTADTYVKPFEDQVLGTVYYNKVESELPSLKLIFNIPSYRNDPVFHPVNFLCLLLKHFVKESFSYQLADKLGVYKIKCFNILEDYVNGMLMVKFFTDNLINDSYLEIIIRFFSFIEELKRTKNLHEVYESISKVSKYSFMFNLKNKMLDVKKINPDMWKRAHDYSRVLSEYNTDELFRANQVYDNFDTKRFLELLDALTIRNAIIILENDKYKEPKKENTAESKVATAPKDLNKGNKDLSRENKGIKIDSSAPDDDKPTDNISDNKNMESGEEHNGNKSIENVVKRTRILSNTYNNQPQNFTNDIQNKENNVSNDILDSPIEQKQNKVEMTDPALVEQGSPGFDSEMEAFNKEYFENLTDNIVLSKYFEGSSAIPYFDKKLSEAFMAKVEALAKRGLSNVKILSPFNTKAFDRYMILTKCEPPKVIKEDTKKLLNVGNHKKFEFYKEDAKKKWIDHLYNDKFYDDHIDSKKTYALLFKPKDNAIDRLTEKQLYQVNMYKYCLSGDFIQDTTEINPSVLVDDASSIVLNKLYRKTLQPKFVLILTIQVFSYYLKMIKGGESRLMVSIYMDFLCQYLEQHMALNYPELMLQGNALNCKRNNFELKITMTGETTSLYEFVSKFIEECSTLHLPENINELIIRKIKSKKRVILANFRPKSAKKLAMYYLDNLIDKLHIDYSNKNNALKTIEIIDNINAESLASFFHETSANHKLILFACGNISSSQTLEIHNKIQKQYVNKNSDQKIEKLNNKKIMEYIDKLTLKIKIKQHHMIRVQNPFHMETKNIYLSYFKLGRLNKEQYLYLKVLVTYMKNRFFNDFREKLGTSYVATVFYVDYHYVS